MIGKDIFVGIILYLVFGLGTFIGDIMLALVGLNNVSWSPPSEAIFVVAVIFAALTRKDIL